ncbi:manganese ion binding protein [Aureococcus anophagefferens]|nr:manganese ion binding protein [Aureococcus anophagefferens]
MGQISSAPVELIRVQRGGGASWRGAVAEMQGWRADHEDAHFMRNGGGNAYDLFGVLDGHGGSEAARLAAHQKLPELLRAACGGASKAFGELEKRVAAAFVETDAWLRARPEVLRDQSVDHVVARLDGNLAVSRGLGDFAYKKDPRLGPGQQKVSCVPECYDVGLGGSSEPLAAGDLLILACDGIFDVMSNEQLVAAVVDALDAGADVGDVCARVVGSCLRDLHSKDNMTLMVVEIGVDGSAYCYAPEAAKKRSRADSASLEGGDVDMADADDSDDDDDGGGASSGAGRASSSTRSSGNALPREAVALLRRAGRRDLVGPRRRSATSSGAPRGGAGRGGRRGRRRGGGRRQAARRRTSRPRQVRRGQRRASPTEKKKKKKKKKAGAAPPAAPDDAAAPAA